jgi:hypothetical protein
MGKWILILKLLGQDHETGEIDWKEAARLENLTFQVCIEELVELVHMFQMENIEHDVYCMKMPEEQTVEEKDDK